MRESCEGEVEAIVRELEQKEEKHRKKVSSFLSPTTLHLSQAEAYADVIDILEGRILTEDESE